MTILHIDSVGYCQDSIHCEFQDGGRFQDLFLEILEDPAYIDKVPAIPVIERGDRYYAMDGNRRLFVYKKLAEFGELTEVHTRKGFYNSLKFTTKDSGESIEIRNVTSQSAFHREFENLWNRNKKPSRNRSNIITPPTRNVHRISDYNHPPFADQLQNKLNDATNSLKQTRNLLENLDVPSDCALIESTLESLRKEMTNLQHLINQSKGAVSFIDVIKYQEELNTSESLHKVLRLQVEEHQQRVQSSYLSWARASPETPVSVHPGNTVGSAMSSRSSSARLGSGKIVVQPSATSLQTQTSSNSSIVRPKSTKKRSVFKRMCCLCNQKSEE